MRRVLRSFGVIAPCALGILGLLVGGASIWEQETGLNPVTTFMTQSLNHELYDDLFDSDVATSNTNWGFDDDPNGVNGFIDLSLTKELLGISKSGVYRYRIVVTNNGDTSAFQFTVKDYASSNATVLYANEQGLVQDHVVIWSVDVLPARASRVFILELKKIARGDVVNKAELCDYGMVGESADPDSNPCTMGADGVPGEDDEAVVSS